MLMKIEMVRNRIRLLNILKITCDPFLMFMMMNEYLFGILIFVDYKQENGYLRGTFFTIEPTF